MVKGYADRLISCVLPIQILVLILVTVTITTLVDKLSSGRQISLIPHNVQAFVRFPISALFPSYSLLVMDTSYTPSLPIPLKLGDVNLDGFTDLLSIFVSPEGDHTPKMMLSVSCGRGV